tara:strand:- start:249 stop:398 length:150 start_codon:yes stop_codon:yes gene_type:complete
MKSYGVVEVIQAFVFVDKEAAKIRCDSYSGAQNFQRKNIHVEKENPWTV